MIVRPLSGMSIARDENLIQIKLLTTGFGYQAGTERERWQGGRQGRHARSLKAVVDHRSDWRMKTLNGMTD